MTIREATIDDKYRLIEMATRFILSSIYGEYLQVVPDLISAHVERVLANGVIFVAELEEGPIVGMLAMVGPAHLIDGKRYAEEVAWWVEPEFRNGTLGPRLMHKMEGWCVQNSVDVVKMLAPAGSDVGDFYSKCGYRAVETAWVKVFS